MDMVIPITQTLWVIALTEVTAKKFARAQREDADRRSVRPANVRWRGCPEPINGCDSIGRVRSYATSNGSRFLN
jgi:hypothetical protein